MTRQRRLNLPGAIYHVITRGLNRAALFKDKADRKEFLRRFALALNKTSSKCYAWALMTNHVHLLVRTSEKFLSELMRKMLTGYAIYFNHRHKRTGYLYQNRFKSILCQEDNYLLELIRYIHLNPVRADFITTIGELDKYPWTGHSVYTRKQKFQWQSTDKILGQFGTKKSQAQKAYQKFIEDGWFMGKREELVGGGIKRSAGGWRGMLELKRNKEYWRGEEQILGDGEFVNAVLKRAGWHLERIAEKVCGIMSVGKEDLRKKGRGNNITYAKG
jgi:REP element-mobilizing transposase RayT